MTRVLGLGVALVTVSGCAWYLPALTDLRARDDRPVSRRTAAIACLTGWSTAGAVALLLLVGVMWPVPCAVAVAGAAGTSVLRAHAGAQQRAETREVARHWATLEPTAPRHGRSQGRMEHYVFAALVACGVVVALIAETLLMAAGPGRGGAGVAVAMAPTAILGAFLVLAATYARMSRHRITADRRRGPR
ncbi:hypothetical protein B1R27_23180 [Streptomyces sp. GKU 895]|nr:hypothetical protein B1R27_23180 [Streptomyces sp. GKU 895]